MKRYGMKPGRLYLFLAAAEVLFVFSLLGGFIAALYYAL